MIIYVTCIILGLVSERTFAGLLSLASNFYLYIDSTVQGKMNVYFTDNIPEYAKMTSLRYFLSILNSSIFIFVFYYFKNKYFKDNSVYNLLFNLYFIGISFNRIVFQIIPDLARLTSLFTGGFIIMIMMIIDLYKKPIRIFLTICILSYLFIAYYNTINGFYADLYIPYYSIFSDNSRLNVY